MDTTKYQSFIGLETHIQLLSETKIFCSCRAHFGDEPNTNICPVCMGYPGALPSLNEEAMKKAYVVARALNCELADEALFDRKNYFYPDLPKNYQISQFHKPVGVNGYFDIEVPSPEGNGETVIKRVRIHDVHLEEDAGKMIHAGDMSLCDYNRTGTPLLEIVTEPDLTTGAEAEAYMQQFRRLVRYLGVCDGNMEEGSLRCDANVSVNTVGAGLGRKVEVKNMNSFRFVRKAISYEIDRHADMLDEGKTVMQETRLWNENRDITLGMRSKEESNDYRYFPDPDLPPFRPNAAFITEIEARQVEQPRERRDRLMADHKLTRETADFLIDEKNRADYFEACLAAGADAGKTADWMSGEVKMRLNRENLDYDTSPLTPARLADLLARLDKGEISGKIAKDVLRFVFEEDKDPAAIIEERGMKKVSDPAAIKALAEKVMAANPQAVETVRGGDAKAIGFLMGMLMKESGGKADPAAARKILQDLLKGE